MKLAPFFTLLAAGEAWTWNIGDIIGQVFLTGVFLI